MAKTTIVPDELRAKYGDRLYTVTVDIDVDDYTTDQKEYIFRKPSTISYDRLIKTLSASPSKSSRDFVLDNIIEEQRDRLTTDLEEYPALSQTIVDKLTAMLGLAKSAGVKKL